jgi:hypothetical protein
VRCARALAAGLAAVAGSVGSVGLLAGCGDDYAAVLDSQPIVLQRAQMGGGRTDLGALLVTASLPDSVSPTFPMLVDTGTALTLLGAPVATTATEKAGFDLIDPMPPPLPSGAVPDPAVRGTFRGVSLLRLPLQPIGDGSQTPGAILGGDILKRYSVDFRLGATCIDATTKMPTICSSMTFWAHLGPDLGFLEDAGYAVLRFSPFGGGETTAQGDADFLGERGPLVLAPTRIVLRACAAPAPFTPDLPTEMCCKNADAARLATGADLALLLDTGVGPMVLSQSAWARVKAKMTATMMALPPEQPGGQLLIATWPTPIEATWSSLPKFALVDNEAGSDLDPGPCVELGRARRIEQVSYQVVNGTMPDACTQPCDNDPRETDKAQNSAAYLELTGDVAVAVIRDDEPYLQGLRFDVRPEGPEVDGLLGAGALGRARVELDSINSAPRAVFSCEVDVPRDKCWAAARCPRLPDSVSEHRCFGLPPHRLAPMCAPSGC